MNSTDEHYPAYKTIIKKLKRDEILANFNSSKFSPKDIDNFAIQISKYDLRKFKTATKTTDKIFATDSKSGKVIYYPLWNDEDIQKAASMIYNQEIPIKWDNELNGLVKITYYFLDQLCKISSIHLRKKEIAIDFEIIQRLINCPTYEKELSIYLLPQYILFFTNCIYTLIYDYKQQNPNFDVTLVEQAICSFIPNIDSDYDDIFLAFRYYLSWIRLERYINRIDFLKYYANLQINKISQQYDNHTFSTKEEAIKYICKRRNINYYYWKDKLPQYGDFFANQKITKFDNKSTLSWELLLDCILNQKNDNLLPIKELVIEKKDGKFIKKYKWIKKKGKGQKISTKLNICIEAERKKKNYMLDINTEFIHAYFSSYHRKFTYTDIDSEPFDKITRLTLEKLTDFQLLNSTANFFKASLLLYSEIIRLLL